MAGILKTLRYAVIAVGFTAASFGAVRLALASGNNGSCGGQIVETLQPNGTWKKTNTICAGLCPVPSPGQSINCELFPTGPAVNRNGHIVTPKVCACVTYDEFGMFVSVQIDQSMGSNRCDVKSWWNLETDEFYDAICSGKCLIVGHDCTEGDPVTIVPGVRVKVCDCP